MCDRCSSALPKKHFTCSHCKTGKYCSVLCGDESLKMLHGKGKCDFRTIHAAKPTKSSSSSSSVEQLLQELECAKQDEMIVTEKLLKDMPLGDGTGEMYKRMKLVQLRIWKRLRETLDRFTVRFLSGKGYPKVVVDQVMQHLDQWRKTLHKVTSDLAAAADEEAETETIGEISNHLQSVYDLLGMVKQTDDPKEMLEKLNASIILDEAMFRAKQYDPNDDAEQKDIPWWDRRYDYIEHYIKTGKLVEPDFLKETMLNATRIGGKNDNNNNSNEEEEEKKKKKQEEEDETKRNIPQEYLSKKTVVDKQKWIYKTFAEHHVQMEPNAFRRFMATVSIVMNERRGSLVRFGGLTIVLVIAGWAGSDWIINGYRYHQDRLTNITESAVRTIQEEIVRYTELDNRIEGFVNATNALNPTLQRIQNSIVPASPEQLANFTLMHALNLGADHAPMKMYWLVEWCKVFLKDIALHQHIGENTMTLMREKQWANDMLDMARNISLKGTGLQELLFEAEAKRKIIEAYGQFTQVGAEQLFNQTQSWLADINAWSHQHAVVTQTMTSVMEQIQTITSNRLDPLTRKFVISGLLQSRTKNVLMQYIEKSFYNNETWISIVKNGTSYTEEVQLFKLTGDATAELQMIHNFVMRERDKLAALIDPTFFSAFYFGTNSRLLYSNLLTTLYAEVLGVCCIIGFFEEPVMNLFDFDQRLNTLMESGLKDEGVFVKKQNVPVMDIINYDLAPRRVMRACCSMFFTGVRLTPHIVSTVALYFYVRGAIDGGMFERFWTSTPISESLTASQGFFATLSTAWSVATNTFYYSPPFLLLAHGTIRNYCGVRRWWETLGVEKSKKAAIEAKPKREWSASYVLEKTVVYGPAAWGLYKLITLFIWISIVFGWGNIFRSLNPIGNQPHWPQYQTREDRIRKTRNVVILE